MSDRLTELQRQRALAQEQLAWIEREIARESGQPLPVAPFAERGPAAAPRSAMAAVRTTAEAAAAAQAAEEILARYQQAAPTTAKDVKRGCYLYFIFALGLLVLGVLGFWFARTRM